MFVDQITMEDRVQGFLRKKFLGRYFHQIRLKAKSLKIKKRNIATLVLEQKPLYMYQNKINGA